VVERGLVERGLVEREVVVVDRKGWAVNMCSWGGE